MDLTKLRRRIYTTYETPIERLDNLSAALGDVNVYIKRDDLLGLAGGGNKTRKLEFLIADALDKKHNYLITCGAVQSNHCRLTLAAARKEGLKCFLVLEERVPGSYDISANGNNFLFHLMGVDGIKVVSKGSDMMKEMQKVAKELTEKGYSPYIIPGGGSNHIGSLGYVACAHEVYNQMFRDQLRFDYIFVPSGSGGTHSGLLLGLRSLGCDIPIIGISVSRDEAAQIELIKALIARIKNEYKVPVQIGDNDFIVDSNYVGPGYSLPTDSMIEAVQMLAQLESILIDPVYSGKAMAGMIDYIRSANIEKGANVLFIHTGGSPALYNSTEILLG